MSKLQRYTAQRLYHYFPEYTIRENYRPEWLQNDEGNRIELDFYIPELAIAIEVQGQQHYVFSPFFHGDIDGFNKLRNHDGIKKEICESLGIKLFEISAEDDLDKILPRIKSKLPPINYTIFPETIEIMQASIHSLYKHKKKIARKNHADIISRTQLKNNRKAIRSLSRNITKATESLMKLLEQQRGTNI